MSITETPDEQKPKPRHRRANRRRKRPAAAAPPKPSGEFVGLTVSICPSACSAERCVISGINICMHPAKGAPQVHTAEALGRFNAAKKLIGKQKITVTD